MLVGRDATERLQAFLPAEEYYALDEQTVVMPCGQPFEVALATPTNAEHGADEEPAAAGSGTAHDPICHMDINSATAAGSAEHEATTRGCRVDFTDDPVAVLAAAAYDHSRWHAMWGRTRPSGRGLDPPVWPDDPRACPWGAGWLLSQAQRAFAGPRASTEWHTYQAALSSGAGDSAHRDDRPAVPGGARWVAALTDAGASEPRTETNRFIAVTHSALPLSRRVDRRGLSCRPGPGWPNGSERSQRPWGGSPLAGLECEEREHVGGDGKQNRPTGPCLCGSDPRGERHRSTPDDDEPTRDLDDPDDDERAQYCSDRCDSAHSFCSALTAGPVTGHVGVRLWYVRDQAIGPPSCKSCNVAMKCACR